VSDPFVQTKGQLVPFRFVIANRFGSNRIANRTLHPKKLLVIPPGFHHAVRDD